MFVIVTLLTLFYTQCIGMFTVYFPNILHVTNFSNHWLHTSERKPNII